MATTVVFEVSVGRKATVTAREFALVGLLARVDSQVRFQVAPLPESLPALRIGTQEGLFACLPE